jgi:hypothetical protein
LENNKDKDFNKLRNQQSNFETLLQIISMRSQPEDITNPVKEIISDSRFSSSADNALSVWSFTFTVSHSSVFNDGINDLGNLINDCDGVPMIVNLDEIGDVGSVLVTTDPGKNIIFEVTNV